MLYQSIQFKKDLSDNFIMPLSQTRISKVGNYSKATRSNIIKIYETHTTKNPAYIFDQLIENQQFIMNLFFQMI